MKATFLGYYPPAQQQLDGLWRAGRIIVDTNVLLDLYRLPAAARVEVIDVLDAFRERLWIPYQVALEFQVRRLSVISASRRTTESALKNAHSFVNDLCQSVEALQVDKSGLGISAGPLLADLRNANEKLVDAIEGVLKTQIEISSSDPIRDRLDDLFSGRVGPGPMTQSDLDALTEGGEERYRSGIPPGFADGSKEKNPSDSVFIHDHLRYERKFGDLILWKQILVFAKEQEEKNILFVTADNKEDWWWREHGKTMGPHPELSREIKRLSGVDNFWMYSSAQFIEHAAAYTTATISPASVQELRSVQEAATRDPLLRKWLDLQESLGDKPSQEPTVQQGPGEVNELSFREIEVLRWTAAGKTSSEIAQILGISSRTVNFHITAALIKLDAVNKTQAIVKAIMLDLLKPDRLDPSAE